MSDIDDNMSRAGGAGRPARPGGLAWTSVAIAVSLAFVACAVLVGMRSTWSGGSVSDLSTLGSISSSDVSSSASPVSNFATSNSLGIEVQSPDTATAHEYHAYLAKGGFFPTFQTIYVYFGPQEYVARQAGPAKITDKPAILEESGNCVINYNLSFPRAFSWGNFGSGLVQGIDLTVQQNDSHQNHDRGYPATTCNVKVWSGPKESAWVVAGFYPDPPIPPIGAKGS